ncbi:MAG: stage II sporulation protein M [Halovenus sp.]
MRGEWPSASHLLAALQGDLRAAWLAHRSYVFGSTLLLFGSMSAGVLFWQRGRGVSDVPASPLASQLLPRQFSVTTLLGDNMELFSLLVVGALTLGILTAVGLVAQGVVAGYFLAGSAGQYGTGLLAVAIVPHNVPMLAAFVLAAAISFRLVVCTLGRLVGARPRTLTTDEWRQAGLLLACAWLVLLGAALIEAYLTFWLTDFLF